MRRAFRLAASVVLLSTSVASADDGGGDAAASAWSMTAPVPTPSTPPAATSARTWSPPPSMASASPVGESTRPPPGPAVRDRSERRRRTNPASGPVFLGVLVALMIYYVVKRLRR